MKQEHKILSITSSDSCNNNCVFCAEERIDKEIDLRKTYVFSQLARFSDEVEGVIFGNHEPTLNPALLDYVKYARKRKYRCIGICTNGRRLSYAAFASALLRTGVNKVIISIHGHTAKIHDALTRSPGSFNQTLKGLTHMHELKKKYSFSLDTSTVLTKLNYPFIAKMLKFLFHFNDIDTSVLNIVQPRGSNMEHFFRQLMPKYSDIAESIEKAFTADASLFYRTDKGKITPRVAIQAIPLCVFKEQVRTFIGQSKPVKKILPDGSLSDIRSLFETYTRTEKKQECRKCKALLYCEGVPGVYAAHYGWDEFEPIL